MPARRFRFGLQKVLDLREWEEKQAENDLAAKTGQCAACERTIEELYLRRRNTFLARGSGGLDLTLLAVHDAFRLRLGKEIETKEKELARLTVEREDLLKVYLEKRKRREVLSKLQEKQALAFKAQAQKREALVLDDLNTASFIRKMRPVEDTVG
jgi:flagellar FliJ protein